MFDNSAYCLSTVYAPYKRDFFSSTRPTKASQNFLLTNGIHMLQSVHSYEDNQEACSHFSYILIPVPSGTDLNLSILSTKRPHVSIHAMVSCILWDKIDYIYAETAISIHMSYTLWIADNSHI